MMNFWLFVALLLLAALGFVWWPVLMQRRSQPAAVSRQDLNVQAFESQIADLEADLQAERIDTDQFDALKLELERNLLGDVAQQSSGFAADTRSGHKRLSLTAMLLSVMILAGVFGLYLKLGSSSILQEMETQQALVHKLSELNPEQRVTLLEQETVNNPQQANAWYALANIYFQQGRPDKTKYAYDQLLTVVGEDSVLLAEYAQVLFFMSENKVTAEVAAVAERALRVDPRNVSALGLLGINAFESGFYSKAIAAWQTALSVAPDAQGAEALQLGIERARALMGEDPQAATGAHLTVVISLDEALANQVDPEQVVFVLARAVTGSKMPLAAHKLRVKDLPATVILNDDMAMKPELKLSSAEEVEVLARVSTSGQPTAQAGDLQGSFRPVNVSSQQAPIKIVIDQVVE